MKKLIYSILLAGVMIFTSTSCELDGLQQSPNALAPDQADVDFVLNSIQFTVKDWFWEVASDDGGMVRQNAEAPRDDSYFGFFQAVDFDNYWELTYAGIVADAANLIALAEERELFIHAGIAKTIRAYALMVTVDRFGDIPLTEALDGTVLEPASDPGADVYAQAEADLDAAIEDFGKTSLGSPDNDLFYGGNTDQWVRLANTLKLRIYLTTRLADGGAAGKINALISAGNLIGEGDDWVFTHGTSAAAPDARHEWYVDNYPTGASDYQSTWFMWLLRRSKEVIDPRIRFYFYRQTLDNTTDVNEQACITEPRPPHYPDDMPFCNELLGDGYWGRDHIDTDGIPPDNLLRTNFGPYPAGGRFDDDSGSPVSTGDGLGGSGIHPIMMASFVDFMLAEAALTMGTTGDPAALLESGIRKSINFVINFGSAAVPAGSEDFIPTQEDIDAYVAAALDNYNSANDDQKLNIILTEYHIASFGNGIEAFNAYRRTGKPDNLQFPLLPTAGDFPRSFFYPNSHAERNQNVDQKSDLSVRVFWDQGPGGLR